MGCPELEELRHQARALRAMLVEKVSKSRELSGDGGSPWNGSHTDYEPFLKHQLSVVADSIAQHRAKHGCE